MMMGNVFELLSDWWFSSIELEWGNPLECGLKKRLCGWVCICSAYAWGFRSVASLIITLQLYLVFTQKIVQINCINSKRQDFEIEIRSIYLLTVRLPVEIIFWIQRQ